MKAQASSEFLLNFLLMLSLISILLASFQPLISASKSFSSAVSEKAENEQFARTLDAAESILHERFVYSTNSSLKSETGSSYVQEAGTDARGYTIYGIGGDYGEPV